jgi:hypothetical protein
VIQHGGQTEEVRLRQEDFGDSWVTLGTFAYDDTTASVRATDAAGTAGEQLAWDAMRWTPAAIPPNVDTDGATTTVDDPEISGPSDFVTHFVGVGFHDDLLRTYAQGANGRSVTSATWRPSVADGTYDVEAYVPSQHGSTQVGYSVSSAAGPLHVVVDQRAYRDVWVSLGRYALDHASASVTSDDATGVRGEEIAWDAVRFEQQDPAPVAQPVIVEQQASDSVPTETVPVSAPTAAAGSHVSTTTTAPPARVVGKPLIRRQRADLLVFDRRPLLVAGRGTGLLDIYELVDIRPTGAKVRLSYRCGPCLVLRRKADLLPSGRPPTTAVRGRLSASHLLHRLLYKGSAIRVVATQAGRRSRTYAYRLQGARKIVCTTKALGVKETRC